MKRIIIFLATLISVCFGTSIFVFAEDGTTVSGDNVEATGDYVDYSVFIENNCGLAAYQISLSYDGKVFSVDRDNEGELICSQGEACSGGVFSVSEKSGQFKTIWANTSNSKVNGMLFTVRLVIADDAPLGEYPVQVKYSAKNTMDKNEEPVALTCIGGTITLRRFSSTIVGASKEVKGTEEFDYAVSISDNPGIAGYRISLTYDKTVMEPILDEDDELIVSRGENFLVGGLAAHDNDGVILINWYNSKNVLENGELFSIRFRAKDILTTGTYKMTLESDFENTLNEEEDKIRLKSTSGSVTITPRPRASFYGANIDIGAELKFQIFATIPENASEYYVRVTDLFENTETTISESSIQSGNLYKFVFKVLPTEMSKTFRFDLMIGDKVDHSIDGYSIQVYCRSTKKNYGTDTKLMTLLADMLEYGAAAQQFENKYLDKLANDLDWVEEYKSSFSDLTTNMTYSGTGDSDAKFSGAALDLTNVVNIQFVVKSTNATGLEATLIRTTNGVDTEVGTYTVTQETFALRTDPIKAYEQEDVYTAVLKRNGIEIMRLSYGIQAYVASYQHTTKYAYLDALTQRLWRYGKSARAYKFGITEDIEN